MTRYKPLPSAERLNELLSYDRETGALTWKVLRRGFASVGSKAGLSKKRGHLEVKVDGVRYQAHRLIWKMVTGQDPAHQIDHRDLDPSNNAWANLRDATQAQNLVNRPCDPRSAIGLKGVTASRGRGGKVRPGKFKAQITFAGTMIYIGQFDTAEAAHAAYCDAAEYLHGEFACFGERSEIA
jgi:hypothetical protein